MNCTDTNVPTIGSIGERLDLLIRQGANFGPVRFTMTSPDGSLFPASTDTPVPESAFVPVDLTGCTIRGQIRKKPGDTDVAAALSVTVTDAPAGRYELSLSAATTAGLTAGANARAPESTYVWDLELVDSGGAVIPLYWGSVQVHREVTRV